MVLYIFKVSFISFKYQLVICAHKAAYQVSGRYNIPTINDHFFAKAINTIHGKIISFPFANCFFKQLNVCTQFFHYYIIIIYNAI